MFPTFNIWQIKLFLNSTNFLFMDKQHFIIFMTVYFSFSEWSMIEYFGSYIFITKQLTKCTIPYTLKTQIHILMAFQGTCMLCSSVFYQWYFCPMFISSSLIKITFYHHDDDSTVDHNVTHLVTPSYYTNKFKHHFKY